VSDLVIKGAIVVDGTGGAPVAADVAVADGVIADVGPDLTAPRGAEVVRADGLALAPGFIDLHTHSDFTLPVMPRAHSMLSQGVTTQLAGNCGFSPFPAPPSRIDLLREYTGFLDGGLDWGRWQSAGEYFALLDTLPLAGNITCQVGHGTVRIAVMGFDTGEPDDGQLETMRRLVAESVHAGAVAISSGLTYAPASSADLRELVAVAEAAKSASARFYSTHLRSEAIAVSHAIDEAIQVGARSGLPVQVSHLKIMGECNWPKIDDVLRRIDDASSTVDVAMDQYPYTAGSTTLAIIAPRWATEGGTAMLQRRLHDPVARERIHRQIATQDPADLARGLRAFEPENIVIAEIPDPCYQDYVGMSMAQIAEQRDSDPVTTALDLLQRFGGEVLTVVHGQSEQNLRRIMRHPRTAVASDGWTLGPEAGGRPHPRNYGTFPRVLGRYVREAGELSLEEAVRKMTSLPAGRLNLRNRGVVRPGYVADLVLFSPEAIIDNATFDEPHRFSTGVSTVIVAGQIVYRDGEDTGARSGRLLRQRGGAMA
jgi:N-acyl-D-amino-acid deacylase